MRLLRFVRPGLLPVVALTVLLAPDASAQSVAEEGLKEVRFQELSDTRLGTLAAAALGSRKDEWKHAETENFIFHYLDSAVAKQVAVEAEFFHRTIAKDLGREGAREGRKGRVIIFDPQGWAIHRRLLALDPLTGGAHLDGELMLGRDADKFGGAILGHEIAHLALHRFYPGRIPLWLDEGYAEYISTVLLASFHRARGYKAKPRLHVLAKEDFIPLDQLTSMRSYPSGSREVVAFYIESQRLVAFLRGLGKDNFSAFLDALAKGSFFESALDGAYGGRFSSRRELEEKFREEVFRETP